MGLMAIERIFRSTASTLLRVAPFCITISIASSPEKAGMIRSPTVRRNRKSPRSVTIERMGSYNALSTAFRGRHFDAVADLPSQARAQGERHRSNGSPECP